MMRGRPESPRFERRPPKPTMHPRKVTGGMKIKSKEGPVCTSWSGQRWLRVLEQGAPTTVQTEGLEYARLGQIRSLDITGGQVKSVVQGRMPRAYDVSIPMPVISSEDWDGLLEAMREQAVYAAALLSGEVPSNIEDLFNPLGHRLFPLEAMDVATSCTCENFKEASVPWCKHIA